MILWTIEEIEVNEKLSKDMSKIDNSEKIGRPENLKKSKNRWKNLDYCRVKKPNNMKKEIVEI